MILQYSENPNKEELDIPEAAKKSEDPQDITSNEELFLTGLHLEQYRHATYLPDPYYLEGLSRDPGDIRINNAYGLLLYRRGLYQESEFYFKKAKERLLWKNPNPYDGEVLYNLGLSLKMQGRLQEAYDAFYKSVWNDAIQGKGYFQLATIQARWQDYDEMLRLLDQSLIKGQHNLRARLLKSVALRKLGRTEKAIEWTAQTMGIDLLDCGALHETFLLSQNRADLDKMIHIMRSEPNSYLELAISYMDAGCYQEAINILQYDKAVRNYPMVQYYTAYSHNKLGNLEDAKAHYMKADKLDPSICFPNKLMSIKVLEDAIQTTPELPKAYYYLGNLFYDKLIHEKAITLWEQSRQLDSEFPTVHRNLGLAYYNKKQDYLSAKSSLERAYQLNKSDSRVFYELDQLYKRTNIPFDFRLKLMEDNLKTFCYRDDFYIEYVTVLNNVGQYQKAYDLLMKRQFHVWEGGEGRVVEQYIFALKHMAFNYMVNKDYANAISTLEKAKVYPHNLGEGKLINAQENDINYYLGVCHKQLGNTCYQDYFVQATKGTSEPTAAMFYNDAKPDSIYYQGFALLALDNQEQAEERFMKMIEYAATHINDHVRVDYFAISLPTFLIYHEDLQKSNKVHCHYLSALGHLGLGNKNKAQQHLSQAQQLDINHQGIRMIQNMFGL